MTSVALPPAKKRDRWSIRIHCVDSSGSEVILFEGRFPSLHEAADACSMTYPQLNAIHKKGVPYGPHTKATKWSPTFEVVKLCDGPRMML